MTIDPQNLDSVLRALADAIHSEGPAVRFGTSPSGAADITTVDVDEFEDAAVVVSTSGSTGTPKETVLSVEALAASSMATAMALQGEGQWLLALPLQYVAGVQVLVRSLFAGTRPWAMDLSGGFTPEAFTAAALELTDRTRFTSLVPTQLQRLLEDPSPETLAVLRRFNAILLGGAPAAPELLAAAKDAGVNVVTTYGSAETCGGCVYNGVPLEAVQVRIVEGKVQLGGDVIASGYLGQAELSEAAFLSEGDTRWYLTNDLGALDVEGRLTVLGRADDVIISGGEKIAASVVAAQLEKVSGVSAAFVAGVPSAQWGQSVAAIVESSDPELDAEKVRAAVGTVLGHSTPKVILVEAQLTRLANGKVDRLTMIELLAEVNQGK
ncbi:AMP-binding protein [Pseudarthrobacter sp. J1763]|uniref:AMP-binding protein n=1 Tax=Pseudarthrobacter sp. J1763 TaxID=3420445 RepID=UPI003D2E8683